VVGSIDLNFYIGIGDASGYIGVRQIIILLNILSFNKYFYLLVGCIIFLPYFPFKLIVGDGITFFTLN